MTESPQNAEQSAGKNKIRFEWGNFLQGGLALYLLAIFVLATAVPTIVEISFLPDWLYLQITPTVAYFMIFFGVILLLMATGLTFFGDLGAMLTLFQVSRGEKIRKPMSTVTVSGNRFMANARVKSMPEDLRQTLLKLVRQGKKLEAIARYRQETKTDPRFAADVIEQLLEFEARGLLENSD